MTAYRFIDAEKAHHTVRMICRVINVSRAAYYVWRDAQRVSHDSGRPKPLPNGDLRRRRPPMREPIGGPGPSR